MKKKYLFLIMGIILLCICLLLCTIDIISKELSSNSKSLLRIFEIILASSATLLFSFTFSVSLNIKNSSVDNKLKDSNGNELIQQSGDGTLTVDFSTHNDPEVVVKAIKEYLVPYQQNNIEKIAEKTYKALENERKGNVLDKDFVIKYLSESSTITNEDIQDIWVKLLLQENRAVGSISKRTMDIVKNLSSVEAKLFASVACLALKDGSIHNELLKQISFMDISKLQDIGLIKSNDFVSKIWTIDVQPFYLIEDGIILEIINNNTTNEKIEYQCNLLTSEGLELKKALEININQKDFLQFAQSIKKDAEKNKYLKVSAHKIIAISGNTVNFNTIDLL